MHHDKQKDRMLMIYSGIFFVIPILLMVIGSFMENIALLILGSLWFMTFMLYAMATAVRNRYLEEQKAKQKWDGRWI